MLGSLDSMYCIIGVELLFFVQFKWKQQKGLQNKRWPLNVIFQLDQSNGYNDQPTTALKKTQSI